MPLFVEFEASDNDVVNDLVAHKIGLNIFLPKEPPEREHGDEYVPVNIFLELVVSGITISCEDSTKKIGLRIKPIFRKDDDAPYQEWKNCSSMFLEPVDSKLSETPESLIGKSTLYGYLSKNNSITICKNDEQHFYFVKDELNIYPGKIGEVRSDNVEKKLESGYIYLHTKTISNLALSSIKSDNNTALAIWIKWSEQISTDYFKRTIDPFEHRLEIPYSGIKKKIENIAEFADIVVKKLEVIVTLPKGCRDESDHKPLPPKPFDDSVKSVSDWVEKKEKVYETNHIFSEWNNYELEDRRFVMFSADSKETGNSLINKKLEVSIRDKQGDVQRYSDLTVASVVVAVAAGIIVPEVKTICEVIGYHLSLKAGVLIIVALLAFLFIIFFGFSYIECRVYGRRWAVGNLNFGSENPSETPKNHKKGSWLKWKKFVTLSTQSHRRRSIYFFTGIMIFPIIVFEMVFYFINDWPKQNVGIESSSGQDNTLKEKVSAIDNVTPPINKVPSSKAAQ